MTLDLDHLANLREFIGGAAVLATFCTWLGGDAASPGSAG